MYQSFQADCLWEPRWELKPITSSCKLCIYAILRLITNSARKFRDSNSDQSNNPLGMRQVYKATFRKVNDSDEDQGSLLFFLSSDVFSETGLSNKILRQSSHHFLFPAYLILHIPNFDIAYNINTILKNICFQPSLSYSNINLPHLNFYTSRTHNMYFRCCACGYSNMFAIFPRCESCGHRQCGSTGLWTEEIFPNLTRHFREKRRQKKLDGKTGPGRPWVWRKKVCKFQGEKNFSGKLFCGFCLPLDMAVGVDSGNRKTRVESRR